MDDGKGPNNLGFNNIKKNIDEFLMVLKPSFSRLFELV